jgi:hypothetical protein
MDVGADRIVSGGMPANRFDSPGALIADQITGLLGIVTTTGIVVGSARAANIPQQAALSAITTPQNLFTQVMAGGSLNLVGRTLRVRGTLIYSTTSTNVATITIALKLGAVTLCSITTAATNTAASANLPIQFEFLLTVVTAGSAGMINAHGSVTANIGTVAAPNTAIYLDTNIAAQGPVDLTIAETLAVTIAASAAVPSAQLLSAAIDILS